MNPRQNKHKVTAMPKTKSSPSYVEFLALMATIISITALSIDIMLPALPEIGRDLQAGHPNDAQLVITFLLLGMGIGQMLFGPLSDCFGRKPIITAGFVIFILGCVLSILAPELKMMLAGRLIQGFGAAGPRTAIVALIRDQHGGRAMARIMSAIMAVFILVPALAPALGQVILLTANWRVIFWALIAQALIAVIWFCIRQPETLLKQNRIAFSLKRILGGVVEVCTNRQAFGFTLAAGFMSGALMAYLHSAQQIFQEVYHTGNLFPLYTAFISLFMGAASLVNSRLVMRLGMRSLAFKALYLFLSLVAFYLAANLFYDGRPPFWLMLVCLSLSFFCLGIMFGNLNAIAMNPLKHIAGIGAAVIGSLISLVSSPLAMVVGRCYDGTTLPMAWGFVVLGVFTALVMRWANRSKTP